MGRHARPPAHPPVTPARKPLDAQYDNPSKAPHPNAVIVKQEAGWFQLRIEKRQRKTTEKLAVQQEKERLAKEAKDARNQVVLLSQLFKR
jgi:hypothetical protein